MAVYLASGNVSGGVCDHCQHNTMGHACDMCKPFYYRDPLKDSRDPQVCSACDCDPDGSQDGGLCDGHTDSSLGLVAGQCRCKANVDGARCDRCKAGFFGFSADDPRGCQPCQCDRLGTVLGSSQCDPVSGDCFCKRLVTGRTCNTCLPEHWALSHDLNGCRACECDVGGAVDNHCLAESGQCRCRSHMTGRQCSQVESGYFFMALDFLLYEAELAKMGQSCHLETREQQAGRPATWTGVGFAHVPEGGTVDFHIANIPYSMEYDLLIRYESQMPRDWEEVRISVIRPGSIPTSSPCGNTIPDDDRLSVFLPAGARFMSLSRPVCLERGVAYTLRFEFTRYQDANSVLNGAAGAVLLVDSIALMPRHSSMEMFSAGDPASNSRKQNFERYRCHEGAKSVIRSPMSSTCSKLLSSMSAVVNDGALPCRCDPQGSSSSVCDVRGGQCPCRANVIGRRCDQCAPGTWGFGPAGCKACGCSLEGSASRLCDRHTGQCTCHAGAFGKHCDGCRAGHWGFPNCRPCRCHGHADGCDQRTGACIGCRANTGGAHCERCADGHYGNPNTGPCHPCPCPDGPNSGRHFAATCYQDNQRDRCGACAPGHYGNPSQPSGRCQPCRCNNNIDMSDTEACDRRTGECRKCLYNTEGPDCGVCRSGYFGDASKRNCRKCTCHFLGTEPSQCVEREDCVCQRASGQCQCRPNVTGLTCDHCAPEHWNLASGSGCEPCGCHPNNSVSSSCNEVRLVAPEALSSSPGQEGNLTPLCFPLRSSSLASVNVVAASEERPAPSVRRTTGGTRGRSVEPVTATGVALRPPSATAGLATAFACRGCLASAATSAPEASLASFPTANPATSASGTGIASCRAQISETTDTLNHLEGDLTVVQDSSSEASKELSALEREARELNLTSEQLHQQLDILKNSNFLGAYDSIRSSYSRSQDAERLANESAVTKSSIVVQSGRTRHRMEQLLTAKKDDFSRKNAANKRALGDLSGRLQGLDLKKVNEKVCGTPDDAPCGESPCGGAGCRDDDGNPHCGGLNCDGAVAAADNALERGKHAEKELNKAMREVEALFIKVVEVKGKAEEAKGKAQAALDKALASRKNTERSNNELRDLIKQIREFLMQEEADPDSIEAVANRVLELSIPASPLQIRHLAEEIKEKVSSLSNVDAILQQTRDDIRKAEQLLLEAKTARHQAENAKATTEAVKKALFNCRTAQTSAEKAIRTAKADILDTEARLAQIELKTSKRERDLNVTIVHLETLGREINALKTKCASNSMAAARAEETATMARDKANEAKQILDGQLTDKYHEVQQRVGTKAKAVMDAKKRAESLRDEATKLLQDAQRKLRMLAELEKNYEENQRKLEGKAHQLDGLEDKMKAILNDINKQIQIYNTCQ
ncbi:unnamed protein product [Tetraodon nigroviridis]|uniref:(spotted green pufferfish) hypothetical protein n=1 Tax=Tetraodon nigroviridis TaxID=99883 RepID=Q4TC32_TETNG|nr:unnamed protein product [Tetraodon nigroviridis]